MEYVAKTPNACKEGICFLLNIVEETIAEIAFFLELYKITDQLLLKIEPAAEMLDVIHTGIEIYLPDFCQYAYLPNNDILHINNKICRI